MPLQLVTLDQFRTYFETFGDKLMVVLIPVDGGYVFHSEPIYSPTKAFELKAEKSGRRRVFKSVEAALRLARSIGFSSVQVELSTSGNPQGGDLCTHR